MSDRVESRILLLGLALIEVKVGMSAILNTLYRVVLSNNVDVNKFSLSVFERARNLSRLISARTKTK